MIRRRTVLVGLALPHVALAQALQPQAPEQALTRIAWASCFDQRVTPQPAWEAMFGYRPQLFIAAGDNVYGDLPRAELTPGLPALAAAYERARELGHFQRMAREARLLAVWDDHDFGLNDGGATCPTRREPRSCSAIFSRCRRATRGARARASTTRRPSVPQGSASR